nr:element excision factor XisH family protein [Oscillochloris sp. ZM17-4]
MVSLSCTEPLCKPLIPDRELYLAVREATYYALFEEPVGQLLIQQQQLRVVVFQPEQEEIVRWIP